MQVLNKNELLNKSDIIFCATGNKSLQKNDFSMLKNGCFISSATSGDDEIDIDYSTAKYR